VTPEAAGVDESALSMPPALDRLAAPPIFVCGSARSGTTWTFDLFDRHPEVRAINESWILSQTGGVTNILAQTYWDTAVKDGWEAQVDVPFGARQLVPYEQVARDLGETLARWMVRDMAPSQRYLAAKEPLDVGAASVLFPEARFVHVVRDGRAVALSMKRASESWDPTMGVGLPMTHRAESWRRQVENVRAHRERLGGRYLEIRYEDMLAEPVEQMRRLFGFCGIEHDDDLLERIAADTDVSNYEQARETGFRGGAGGRGWRDDFSLRDAFGFQRAAGDLLIDLGYESSPNWWRAKLPGRG
jgi:hypothetical protein